MCDKWHVLEALTANHLPPSWCACVDWTSLECHLCPYVCWKLWLWMTYISRCAHNKESYYHMLMILYWRHHTSPPPSNGCIEEAGQPVLAQLTGREGWHLMGNSCQSSSVSRYVHQKHKVPLGSGQWKDILRLHEEYNRKHGSLQAGKNLMLKRGVMSLSSKREDKGQKKSALCWQSLTQVDWIEFKWDILTHSALQSSAPQSWAIWAWEVRCHKTRCQEGHPVLWTDNEM
jgi:hypothetical protein